MAVQVNDGQLLKLLSEIETAIGFDQPKLRIRIEGNNIVAEGTYVLSTNIEEYTSFGPVAEYRIRALFDKRYPKVEPQVYETGHSFPHTEDYHSSATGLCCLHVWEVWKATEKDHSVKAYFDGPIHNFFLSQFLKSEDQGWVFGELPHAREGLLEAYAEALQCEKSEEKICYILRLLSNRRPKGSWLCPCGSGIKVRDCCNEKIENLKNSIRPQDAKNMLKRLKSESLKPF